MYFEQTQISVETAIFNGILTTEKLAVFAECGIDAIELCAVKHRVDYHDQAYVDEIADYILRNKINVLSMHLPFGYDLDISSPDSETRNAGISAILSCAGIANKLGSNILVLHPGVFLDEHQNRIGRIDFAIKSIRELIARTSDNLLFAVENLPPGYLADTARELCQIVETVDHNRVGYCIDTGHAHLTSQMDKLVRGCGSKILNVHIHDNAGDKDSHLMPFEGNIDWPATVSLFNEVQFSGLLTYELTNESDPAERIAEVMTNFAALCKKEEVALR